MPKAGRRQVGTDAPSRVANTSQGTRSSPPITDGERRGTECASLDRSIESQMSQLFFSPEISSCSGDMETQAASMVRELHESSDNDNRTGLLGLPEPMSNNNEIDAICRKIQFL